MLVYSGLSRDDDLDLNLNELNLEYLDEPVENSGIGGNVLAASTNFSPSGMLIIDYFYFDAVSEHLLDNSFCL